MIWRALPYALYRRARIGARYVYLRFRHRVRMRLLRIERAKARKGLQMPVDAKPRFDDRSSMDRFRRENGLR